MQRGLVPGRPSFRQGVFLITDGLRPYHAIMDGQDGPGTQPPTPQGTPAVDETPIPTLEEIPITTVAEMQSYMADRFRLTVLLESFVLPALERQDRKYCLTLFGGLNIQLFSLFRCLFVFTIYYF